MMARRRILKVGKSKLIDQRKKRGKISRKIDPWIYV